MRHFILVALLSCTYLFTIAQHTHEHPHPHTTDHAHDHEHFHPHTASGFSCGWHGEDLIYFKGMQFRSNAEAEAVANDIMSVVGLTPNFKIQAAKVPNAAAVVYGQERYVFYNPKFIESVKESTNTNWGGISIMAHEIGHHLNGHTLRDGGSRPDMELQADEFSGFVLRKMGASLEEAQVAMRTLASEYGSATHPAKRQRLSSIEKGWKRADAQVGRYEQPNVPANSKEEVAENTTDIEQPRKEKPKKHVPKQEPEPDYTPISHPAFAQFQVVFEVNPDKLYYITTSSSFVRIRNGKVETWGALVPTNDEEHPYMIDFENPKVPDVLINRKGKLFNKAGKEVGIIRRV